LFIGGVTVFALASLGCWPSRDAGAAQSGGFVR